MNTYWNSNGKHQEWADKISETMPCMYHTNNKYMNIFIAMSNIYYEIYNNGGCNIMDGGYKNELKLIHKFIGRFNSRTAIKNLDYLEDKMNEVFERLMGKDLSFENYGFWNEWKESKISMDEQVGENWLYITCGTKENVEKEFELRKRRGFSVV